MSPRWKVSCSGSPRRLVSAWRSRRRVILCQTRRVFPPRLLASFGWLLALALPSACGRVGLELSTLDAGATAVESGLADVEPARDGGRSDAGLGDRDSDGVDDAQDNCPNLANPGKADLDGNFVGDACDHDGDRDDDGRPDTLDGCPDDPDDDQDGDGVCAPEDRCPRDRQKVEPGPCGCEVRPPPALVAYWSFEEGSSSVLDSVGNYLAELSNFEVESPWSDGPSGRALTLDGIDDRVSVGALGVPIRALSFWLRVRSLPTPVSESPWFSPTRHGSPANDWSIARGAYTAGDGVYTDGDIYGKQDFSGFGAELPPTVSASGVELQILYFNSNPTTSFVARLSWNGGVEYTEERNGPTTVFPVAEFWKIGGMGDRWAQPETRWDSLALADENLRVQLEKRGAPAPLSPGIDYMRLKFYHPPAAYPRTVISLGGGTRIALSDAGLVALGFPSGTTIYVDGEPTSNLDRNWHHVVVVAPGELTVSNFQLGGATVATAPHDGQLDELKLFRQPLERADLDALRNAPACR